MDKKPEDKFETVKIRNPSESTTPVLRPRSPLNRSQGIVTRRCHVVEQVSMCVCVCIFIVLTFPFLCFDSVLPTFTGFQVR